MSTKQNPKVNAPKPNNDMASRYDKAFKIKYKQASAELKSQIDAARGKDVTPKEVTRYIKEVIALAESEEKFV